jgi:hypothetical protein
MLPRAPANRKRPSRPARRTATRAFAAAAPSFAAPEVEALASIRLGRPLGETILPGAPTNRRAAPATGRPVDFRPRRRAGAAPVTSLHGAHFPGTAEGCPSRRHGLRTATTNNGKALWGALCLSCGTSPERIAPESLTRSMSDFVHGHISWRTDLLPPNRVTRLTRLPQRGPQLVNASLAHLIAHLKRVGWRSHRGAAPRRTAITASSRPPCPAAGSRRIASPA